MTDLTRSFALRWKEMKINNKTLAGRSKPLLFTHKQRIILQ